MTSEREAKRFAGLTWSLALTDFKLRYYGNFLGYFWSLLKPLMLFGIIYLVFTRVLDFGDQPHYAASLVIGLVLFNYFAEVTGESVPCLVNNESLLRKLPMPMTAIPLGIALRALLTLGLNLVAVCVILLIDGVSIQIDWLQFPLLVVALVIVTTGMAAILSILYVPFRDTSPIWEVISQVLFWGTPVIYSIGSPAIDIPAGLKHVMLLNPLAMIITQARHVVIGGEGYPSAIGAIGAAPRLAIPIALIAIALPVAALVYRRVGPRLIEQL
jgi:ABC-2 type transport system permease protein